MTTISPSAGIARLVLISDFPIDDEQLQAVRDLFGENTTDRDVEFRTDRKTSQWPLRLRYEAAEVTSLGFHVYLCAGFLCQRKSVVQRIHSLGCNLELCLCITGIHEYLSFASATMKQLADLQVQLSFTPVTGQG